MTAPDLTPSEAAVVALFDAAPPLPEFDAERVEDLAAELAFDLANAGWSHLTEDHRERWRDVARYALSAPGVPS